MTTLLIVQNLLTYLLSSLLTIPWDVDPAIFSLEITESFTWSLRWYSILFMMGLLLSHLILRGTFVRSGKKIEDVENLTLYLIFSVIIGARLGHCLFYSPEYYFVEHPEEIIKVWEGGLASHGAAFGIILAIFIFIKRNPGFSYIWLADQLSVVIPLAAAFVRIGNLMNSEICGIETSVPWAFEFKCSHKLLRGELCSDCAGLPRHPTQLYEALSYLAIFAGMYWLHRKSKIALQPGKQIGLLLMSLFSARFLIEFFKVNQESYVLGLPINTGQVLSLPLVGFGLYFFLRASNTPEDGDLLEGAKAENASETHASAGNSEGVGPEDQ